MAEPPSISSQGPRIARLPQPGNPSAPLVEGLNEASRIVSSAIASREDTQDRVAEMDLQTRRIQRERELQTRTGEAGAYVAERYGQLDIDLLKLRETAGPGALGHEEKAGELIDKARDDVMGFLGNDPELVDRFVDNVAVLGASARKGEALYSLKSRAEYSVANVGKVPESLANSLYTSALNGEPVAEKVTGAMRLLETTVRAQPIPANAQNELIDRGKQTIWNGVIKGRIQHDPGAMVAAIDNGELNETGLTNDQVTALRQQAVTLRDSRASKAESASNEAVKVLRAEASVLIEQVNGGTLVNTAALQAHLGRAKASQDPEDIRQAHDLEVALVRNEVTAKYDSATNAERVAALHEIEATTDWQKNEQLVVAHDHLGKLISRDESDAKADPISLFARQTGAKLAPANIADRTSMTARFAIGDRAAERYGRPPTHLTEAEADQVREQWRTGTPSTQADLVQTIAGYGPRRGRELMRQIAQGKPQFARLVEMAAFKDPVMKGYVREALDGWAQPALKPGVAAAQTSDIARMAGSVLAAMPGDRKEAVLWVSRGIYAHRAARAGGDGFNRDLWRESFNAALGGANGSGGLASAASGLSFVLPMGTMKGDWDLIMSRAGPQDFRAASNGVPKWGTRDMTAGEFKRLTPVLVSDTGTQALYAFRSDSGGFAKTPTGADYVLDYRKLLDIRRARLQGR